MIGPTHVNLEALPCGGGEPIAAVQAWPGRFEIATMLEIDPETERRTLAELIVLLGRLAYGGGRLAGLTPAQWAVLRYFARANRFSRTVSSFAEFHATTRGTASQTVKALTESGYLTRTRSSLDGRSIRFDLTDQAHVALREDPLNDVARAVDQLPPKARAEAARSLRRILADLAKRRGAKEFGTCASCGHLERSEDGDTFRCHYFDAAVEPLELELLCSNFTREA